MAEYFQQVVVIYLAAVVGALAGFYAGWVVRGWWALWSKEGGNGG